MRGALAGWGWPTLAHPGQLWLLLLLPLLALAAIRVDRTRQKLWLALAQNGSPAPTRWRRWLLGLACLIVSLAGPRWGHNPTPPLPPGRDVVLAIDVSRSMGALDAVPDRLGVAVASAADLVKALGRDSGDRVGIVAFAGKAIPRCPLTANLGSVQSTLARLEPGAVKPGGTDLGAALEAVGELFDDQDRQGGRTVILFSDGEDHANRWRNVATNLSSQGIVIHTVGVGDAETGHPVPTTRGRSESTVTYQNTSVRSRRNDAPLAGIAAATGGVYVPLGLASADLGQLFLTRMEPVARLTLDEFSAPPRAERFGLFLLLALGFIISACRPGRSRAFPARALALSIFLCATISAAPGDAPSAVAAGREAYGQGKFADALSLFRQAATLDPQSALIRYNEGAALYQLKKFEEARAAYTNARRLSAPTSILLAKVDLALGNTALGLGDPATAINHYDNCLASHATSAEADQVRADAAINRKFAEEQTLASPQPDTPTERTDQPDQRKNGQDHRDITRKDSLPESSSPPDPGEQYGNLSPTRGTGGAGGGGPSPRKGSPEQRLARAIENIRRAGERRLDESSSTAGDAGEKDW